MEASGKAPAPGQDGKHETILRVPRWKVVVGISSLLKDLKGAGRWALSHPCLTRPPLSSLLPP